MPDPAAPSTAPDPVALLVAALLKVAELAEGGGIVPEGLTAPESARLTGVPVSKWHALNAAGHCPAPVEIGDGPCPRWLRSELLAWMRHGCPVRAMWRHMRDAAPRRVG